MTGDKRFKHRRSTQPAITLWPAGRSRTRHRMRGGLVVILLSVSIIGAALSRWSPISAFPTFALLVLQRSDLNSVWARATLELARRDRDGGMPASQAIQFQRNTYRIELVGPDAAAPGRAFELGLRIAARTPQRARAIVAGKAYRQYVEYHLEQLRLTYADGSPLPHGAQHYFDDVHFAACYRIFDHPNVHGRPVTFRSPGRYRIRLSGMLLVGCPLSCVPDRFSFAAEHDLVVADRPNAIASSKTTDLPVNIRRAVKSMSVSDDGVVSLDFGRATDSIWELKLFVRRSSKEEFVQLRPVLAVGKSDVALPHEYTETERSWQKGQLVDIRICGGFDVLGNERLQGWLPTALPCRYWAGELIQKVCIGTSQE